jgi:predicted dehydrogenase
MISQIAHLPFYLADSRCEVRAIAESRPSLVRHLREHFGISRVVDSIGEFISDPFITSVVIISPRPATGPLALSALEAGKDVIVEKPMAHTVEQAARLVRAATAYCRIIGVAFMKRYDPGVQVAKRELARIQDSGEFGSLLFSRFYDFARDYALPPPPHKRPQESRPVRFETWPTAPDWLPRSRADEYAWFMNAASHDINLMHYFFPDDLHLICATAPSGGALTATFEHAGVPVVFELAKSAAGTWIQGAEFVFEKGRLLLEIPSPMAIDRASRVTINEHTNAAAVRELLVENVWSFKRQAHAFVGDLIERTQPLTSGVDALDDLQLIEAIWRQVCNLEAKSVH